MGGADVILTNRHVAREFARAYKDGWGSSPGMSASIDFNSKLGALEPLEFAVTGIVGIHDRYPRRSQDRADRRCRLDVARSVASGGDPTRARSATGSPTW